MVFPSYDRSMLATKEDILARKFVKLRPRLSCVDVIVVDKVIRCNDTDYPSHESPCSLYKSYVRDLMVGEICDFHSDYDFDKKLAIETRPNSLFQFKKTMVDEHGKPGDVFDTYYSVVDYIDIKKLNREGSDMELGEEKINPLSDGVSHAVDIYVISKGAAITQEVCDLIDMKRKSMFQNMTLHFVVDEATVEKVIEIHELSKKNKKKRIEEENEQ